MHFEIEVTVTQRYAIARGTQKKSYFVDILDVYIHARHQPAISQDAHLHCPCAAPGKPRMARHTSLTRV